MERLFTKRRLDKPNSDTSVCHPLKVALTMDIRYKSPKWVRTRLTHHLLSTPLRLGGKPANHVPDKNILTCERLQ